MVKQSSLLQSIRACSRKRFANVAGSGGETVWPACRICRAVVRRVNGVKVGECRLPSRKDFRPSLGRKSGLHRHADAFGGPGRPRHLGFDPTRGQTLGSRMTRRGFAMPCSFSNRKTARRYRFQGLLDRRSLSHRFLGLAALTAALCVANNFSPELANLSIYVSTFRRLTIVPAKVRTDKNRFNGNQWD